MDHSIPTPSVRNPVEADLPAKGEVEPEVESELELRFLVGDLSRDAQNRFLQAMDTAGLGMAQEGRYLSLSPPVLAEPLPRVATFVFSVIRGPEGTKDTLNLAVADAVQDALTVAHAHNVRLLSASCPAVAEGGAA